MNTIETLQDILVRDYQVARTGLTPDASLGALGIDSLGFLELMFKIEDRFHVKIPGDTPTDLHTLQDVVGYIDALIANRPPADAPAVGVRAREP
ncbi:MAG TPA: phosphopantetheine-binding protein [Steroidobacteraceae bacterium]|nr:phosphopantetheine-binding protein [Steroidobacteraceae bacterium]